MDFSYVKSSKKPFDEALADSVLLYGPFYCRYFRASADPRLIPRPMFTPPDVIPLDEIYLEGGNALHSGPSPYQSPIYRPNHEVDKFVDDYYDDDYYDRDYDDHEDSGDNGDHGDLGLLSRPGLRPGITQRGLPEKNYDLPTFNSCRALAGNGGSTNRFRYSVLTLGLHDELDDGNGGAYGNYTDDYLSSLLGAISIEPKVEQPWHKATVESEEHGKYHGETSLGILKHEPPLVNDNDTQRLILPIPVVPDLLSEEKSKRQRDKSEEAALFQPSSPSPSPASTLSPWDGTSSDSGDSCDIMDQIDILEIVARWKSEMIERVVRNISEGLIHPSTSPATIRNTFINGHRAIATESMSNDGLDNLISALANAQNKSQGLSGQPDSAQMGLASTSLGSSTAVQKRRLSPPSDATVEFVETKGEPELKKRKRSGVPNCLNQRKFACPYYQRDAAGHQKYSSCSGPGWSSIHRLKEHLYRRHAQPIHCSRCYATFDSAEDQINHSRAQIQCNLSDPVLIEGFSKEQEANLRRRNRRPSVTEEQKWKEIYQILFAGDQVESIPDPYYKIVGGEDELGKYHRFLDETLAPLVLRELELDPDLQQLCKNLEEQTKAKLFGHIRNCQGKLFQDYARNEYEEEQIEGAADNKVQLHPDLSAFKPVDPLPNEYTLATPGADANESSHLRHGVLLRETGEEQDVVQESDSGYGTLFLDFMDGDWSKFLEFS